MKRILLLFLTGAMLLFSAHRFALAAPVRVEAVELELVSKLDRVAPGTKALLGLRIRHDPHWHTYWRNPGDSGLPTTLKLHSPAGWSYGPFIWPAPTRIFVGPLASYAYEGELLLPFMLDVPADAVPGSVRLAGKAQWLMCREVCIPGEAELSMVLQVGAGGVPGPASVAFDVAARNTPAGTIQARAALSGRSVSLAIEASEMAVAQSASVAEFFPYAQGWLEAPAPQRLYAVQQDAVGARRLELTLAQDVDREALTSGGFGKAAIGVLRLDDTVFEVRASLIDASLPKGSLISTASGVVDERSSLGRGSLGALLGGPSNSSSSLWSGQQGAQPALGSTAPGLGLSVAMLFAAIGGLLLNLMPCVFPVIGLKVMGFAGHAMHGDWHARRGALAFSAGVVLSFWTLAAVLLALRAAGEAVGWGFQLQSPAFVALMALLFVLIGLNFAGVFEIGLSLTRVGQVDPLASGHGGVLASFGSGVLAVLVATPCTAPFMGSALGYTLTRPALEVMLVFGALGVGMALPYLLLGFVPAALGWMPRPGRWMESFRQFLAFPMFATAAWLSWVLGLQVGIDAVLALAIGAVLVALAGWLVGRFVQRANASRRVVAGLMALGALVAGVWLAWPSVDHAAVSSSAAGGQRAVTDWEAWSPQKVGQAIAERRAVFVDFTAAWCVSCQANKALVLSRDPVLARMRERNVLKLRADWTNHDPQIGAELARHGRSGVPLYLLYVPGEAAPRVLPEILTSGLVLEALAAVR
ncbi:MAG: protein-disulfide reductase DsbD family protein [Quisquiliibacterium sp.]